MKAVRGTITILVASLYLVSLSGARMAAYWLSEVRAGAGLSSACVVKKPVRDEGTVMKSK
jgi:hypothetical protein